MERKAISMTPEERREYIRILERSSVQGAWFPFWHGLAIKRGLDPKTVMADPTTNAVTALPLGHGKQWCWPMRLQCRNRPEVD